MKIMDQPYVSVIGNICSGKTTFINNFVAHHSDWLALPENLSESWIWQTPSITNFQSAIYFMGYYASKHLEARWSSKPVIQESCLQQGNNFCNLFWEVENISLDEFRLLEFNYSVFMQSLPSPDIYIYLYSPLETLLQRAEKREEPIRSFSKRFIPLLQSQIENNFLPSLDHNKILKLNTNAINFNTNNTFITVDTFLEQHLAKPRPS